MYSLHEFVHYIWNLKQRDLSKQPAWWKKISIESANIISRSCN